MIKTKLKKDYLFDKKEERIKKRREKEIGERRENKNKWHKI